MTHRASILGAPVRKTTCPVPGDMCPVSVPGPPIADVVNLQVCSRTAVLNAIKAKFNKNFVVSHLRHANMEMERHKFRRCGRLYFILTPTVVLSSNLIC